MTDGYVCQPSTRHDNNELKTGKNESSKEIKMTCSLDWVPPIKRKNAGKRHV